METSKGILVIGASGLIGNCIYSFLKSEKRKVLGTYHKNKKEGLIPFDISKSSVNNLPIDSIKTAVLCSAITNLDSCAEDLEYSTRVNVNGLEKAIAELLSKGIFPVFLSSGAVFDGVEGGYKEDDSRSPISLYGRQKVEVEDFMKSKKENFLIIRPGKVCDFHNLLLNWFNKYKRGETILCANDEKLSFTSPKDVARGITLLIDNNSTGVYHINPEEHFSRFILAHRFFDYLGIKDAKIEGCSIDSFGAARRAKNSFMDASKFVKETGFEFTKLEDYFEGIKEYNNLNSDRKN